MKIDKRKNVSEDSKIYIRIDREKLLKNFWDEYALCKKRKTDEWEISIYNFWGVGGVGKTELVNELYNELISENEMGLVKVFDEKKSILENILSIRTVLVEQYKADFTLFDLVYCQYCKKIGRGINEFEKESLFSNKLVEAMYPILGVIPGLDILAAIPQALKPYEREIMQKFQDNSFQFMYYSYIELEKRLPHYFIEDFKKFLLKKNLILTVLIDNIDWINGEDRKEFDRWFFEKGALTQAMPNVFWVFASREKISDHYFSEKTVQNCNVERFDDKETKQYLEKLDINEEYFDKIFMVTQGMPLYLELCKETYFACVKSKQSFDISMIGDSEGKLVDSFYKHLNDSHKKLLRLMCFLNSWTENTMLIILERMKLYDLVDEYYEVQNMSFVHKDKDRYYIHDIVGEIVSKHIKKRELEMIMSFGGDLFTETELMVLGLKKDLMLIENEGEFIQHILCNELTSIFFLAEKGEIRDILRCRRIILKYANQYNNVNIVLALVEWNCARAYTVLRESDKSLYFSTLAYEEIQRIGEQMYNYFFDYCIDIKEQYANDLMLCNYNSQSLKLRSEIWSECRRKYGKESLECVMSEHNYCLPMLKNDETRSDGIKRLLKVISKREKIDFGNAKRELNLMHIINAKITLGEAYMEAGEYEKAIKWGQEAALLAFNNFFCENEENEKDFINNRYVERIIYSYTEILMDIREYSSVIDLLERIYESWGRIYDKNSQIMLSLAYCLGIAYGEVGQTEKGKELLRNCYQQSYDKNGKYNRHTLKYKKEYAICIALGGEDEAALELLEECLFAYREIYGEDKSRQLANLEHAVDVQRKKMKLI